MSSIKERNLVLSITLTSSKKRVLRSVIEGIITMPYLGHLVGPALPGETLVVEGFLTTHKSQLNGEIKKQSESEVC